MNLPDKDLSREAWLDIVKPVDMAGRLDKIPARKAETVYDRKVADAQRQWLSKRSYGMPDTDWHMRIYGNRNKLSERDSELAS